MSLEEKADALFLIVALNHFFFFSPYKLRVCVGTRSNSWFQFLQLLERLYHLPLRSISRSSTRPSQKHRRCTAVLSNNHPTTTQKTPSLFIHSPRILLHSVSTNKNTLSVYTGHKITSWNINTKQLCFLLDKQLGIFIIVHYIPVAPQSSKTKLQFF